MFDINTSPPLNKEVIAARMFRHAARYWGYNDTDIDNFDPLVRLLIEACAVELYKISNEIYNVEERMLEKLAGLLTPEVYTAPKPSHAVLHGRPVEAQSTVYPGLQFFHSKKVSSKSNGSLDSNLEIFFSPIGNFSVINADVKIIATGSSVYQMNKMQCKETLFNTIQGKKIAANTVWIGIESDNQIEDLSNLSFFFDLKNHPDKTELFPLIHYSKWSINNRPVDIEAGLWDNLKNTHSHLSTEIFDEFETNQAIGRKINNYYRYLIIVILNA